MQLCVVADLVSVGSGLHGPSSRSQSLMSYILASLSPQSACVTSHHTATQDKPHSYRNYNMSGMWLSEEMQDTIASGQFYPTERDKVRGFPDLLEKLLS